MSHSFTIAVQYLEDSPEMASLTPQAVTAKLRAAGELLPIHQVLLGWNLPRPLVEACASETARLGAQLYRWQPLLTDDGELLPRPEWQVIGLQGEPVPGFRNMPEFTFLCPNKPAVQAAVLTHLDALIRQGIYAGFFLDRIRFPSPAAEPTRWLACFCPDCHRVAENAGLDLALTRHTLNQLFARPEQTYACLQMLLGNSSTSAPATTPELATLAAYLAFRKESVTHFVHDCAALIHDAGLAVGLDCFSPALTTLVGQDLAALDGCAEWTKVMCYCHTLGPAGLPFELLDLADWLMTQRGVDEVTALTWLGEATDLALPLHCATLRTQGLPSSALSAELQRGHFAGVKHLLAGIELVEIPGVAHLDEAQLRRDLHALRTSRAQGVALSWDLWHMPLERLALVREIVNKAEG